MRRLVLVLVFVAAALSVTGCGNDCGAPLDESSINETAEGEFVQRTIVSERFHNSVHEITVRTRDGDVELVVRGRPELLELGQRYQFGLVSYDDQDLPLAFVESDFGCGSGVTTVRLLNEDGSTSAIDIPGLLPSSPISLRTFFLGFIGFVVLIAVFGRSRPSD